METIEKIKKQIEENAILLYMKGSPNCLVAVFRLRRLRH